MGVVTVYIKTTVFSLTKSGIERRYIK